MDPGVKLNYERTKALGNLSPCDCVSCVGPGIFESVTTIFACVFTNFLFCCIRRRKHWTYQG